MKISIITINYNNALGLERTINSVITQNHPLVEYIIIDGGSTDSSLNIIKSHSDKISSWISETDNGIYNAMNKGLKLATGNFCLFLNSGDVLTNNTILHKVSLFITQNPAALIYYGDLYLVGDNKSTIKTYPEKLSLYHFIFNSIGHPSTFINTQYLKSLGGYKENYKIISDWIFFLEAFILQANYKKIPFPISLFETGGLSSNLNIIENEADLAFKEVFPNLLIDRINYNRLKIIDENKLFKFCWSLIYCIKGIKQKMKNIKIK